MIVYKREANIIDFLTIDESSGGSDGCRIVIQAIRIKNQCIIIILLTHIS
jgi:hypothetical protein